MRLPIHIALRQRHAKEDTRYVLIMEGARGRNETLYALKMIYGLQGALIWFVALPLQWAAFSNHFDVLAVAGFVFVAVGEFFEAAAATSNFDDFSLTRRTLVPR